MDTTLSVGLQHAPFKFTMCRSCHISYSQRMSLLPFRARISRKDNGGSSCENSKIGNKLFPASRNVTMSHRLHLLPVTGNYISELITLIILKSGARQLCGYRVCREFIIAMFLNVMSSALQNLVAYWNTEKTVKGWTRRPQFDSRWGRWDVVLCCLFQNGKYPSSFMLAWYRKLFSRRERKPEHEANHTSPFNVEIMGTQSFTSCLLESVLSGAMDTNYTA
jgi:hypothetical protein